MEDLEEEQDVTAWVNGVLSEASADGASVDAKISSVSMKLQIMAADLNDELEGHMEELIEAAPRALGDVGSVSRALAAVDEELAAVQRRVDGASRGGREVRTLDELDRLKTHLEAVGATLREAASWQAAARRAAASLDAFLNRGAEAREPWDAAAGDVAAQLATMGDSERILRKLPDADDRRSTLDGLRDDFEHALRPRVAAALAAPDVSGEALRPLVALYERLGLGEALRRDYAAARPGAARKRWFARTAADDAGLDLAPWLAAFLDDLLRDLEAEKAAAGAAFAAAHAADVAARAADNAGERDDGVFPEDRFHRADILSQHYINQREQSVEDKKKAAEKERARDKSEDGIEYVDLEDYKPGGKFSDQPAPPPELEDVKEPAPAVATFEAAPASGGVELESSLWTELL